MFAERARGPRQGGSDGKVELDFDEQRVARSERACIEAGYPIGKSTVAEN